jgi:hypothetical protein
MTLFYKIVDEYRQLAVCGSNAGLKELGRLRWPTTLIFGRILTVDSYMVDSIHRLLD